MGQTLQIHYWICFDFSIHVAPRRPRCNRQVPRRLQDRIILELIGNRDITSTCSEFEVAVYFPILDLMISKMHKHFDNKNIALMKAVNSCNPTSLSFLETEKVLPKAEANNFFDKTQFVVSIFKFCVCSLINSLNQTSHVMNNKHLRAFIRGLEVRRRRSLDKVLL